MRLKAPRFSRDTAAQVGIGTMIVFIATVLVAATAAAMLLDTSGKLQERSSETGQAATEQVSANLLVKGVYGVRPASTGDLEDINITLTLAPGSSMVDLGQTIIMLTDGTGFYQLNYSQTQANDKFTVREIRDPTGSFTTASPALIGGTLVDIQIDLNRVNGGAGMTLAPREDLTVVLIPEVGHSVTMELQAPSSFGGDTVVNLR